MERGEETGGSSAGKVSLSWTKGAWGGDDGAGDRARCGCDEDLQWRAGGAGRAALPLPRPFRGARTQLGQATGGDTSRNGQLS